MHFCMHSCVYNVCLFIFPNLSYRTKDLTSTFIWLERLELCCNCNSSVAKEFSFRRIFLYTLVTKITFYLLILSNAQGIPVGVLKAGSNFSPSSTAFFRKIWKLRRKKVLENSLQFPVNDISAQ